MGAGRTSGARVARVVVKVRVQGPVLLDVRVVIAPSGVRLVSQRTGEERCKLP